MEVKAASLPAYFSPAQAQRLVSASAPSAATPTNLLPPDGYGESFRMKLEKHINDAQHGKEFKDGVPAELTRKLFATSEIFSQGDTKSLSMLGGILSVFSYDKRARLVNGVAEATRHTNQIKSLVS